MGWDGMGWHGVGAKDGLRGKDKCTAEVSWGFRTEGTSSSRWSFLEQAWELVQFLQLHLPNWTKLPIIQCSMLDVETRGNGRKRNSAQRFLMSRKLFLKSQVKFMAIR